METRCDGRVLAREATDIAVSVGFPPIEIVGDLFGRHGAEFAELADTPALSICDGAAAPHGGAVAFEAHKRFVERHLDQVFVGGVEGGFPMTGADDEAVRPAPRLGAAHGRDEAVGGGATGVRLRFG